MKPCLKCLEKDRVIRDLHKQLNNFLSKSGVKYELEKAWAQSEFYAARLSEINRHTFGLKPAKWIIRLRR